MRPVGEVEHRENLLEFVNWATRGSTAETSKSSTSGEITEIADNRTSSSRSLDGSQSGQAEDISTMESNQTSLGGEAETSGESESKDKKQVC